MSKPNSPPKETKGLPQSIDAERFVLGAILINGSNYSKSADALRPEDFSLEKHRRIYHRIGDLYERGEHIDRVTLINELRRHDELEIADGMAYIVSLDDGMPDAPNVESYVRIVKQKSSLRRAIHVARDLARRCMDESEGVEHILRSASTEITKLEIDSGNQVRAMNPREILEAHPGGISGFMASATAPGLMCGFRNLDELLLGFKPGDVYVVAGITGSGKSAFAANVATGMAKAGHPGLYIPIEMTREQMLTRLISSEGDVPLKALLKGDMMEDQERKAHAGLRRILDLPLYFEDTPSLTPLQMAARVDRAVIEHSIKFVVLDYLQILDLASTKELRFDNENTAITYASRTCKKLAMKHKIPFIVLSQLRRAQGGEKQYDRPKRSELRGSGSIENDASVIIFTHREEMGKPGRPELRGKATIIIDKNRMGATKDLEFEFKGSRVRFEDTADPPFEDPEDS